MQFNVQIWKGNNIIMYYIVEILNITTIYLFYDYFTFVVSEKFSLLSILYIYSLFFLTNNISSFPDR